MLVVASTQHHHLHPTSWPDGSEPSSSVGMRALSPARRDAAQATETVFSPRRVWLSRPSSRPSLHPKATPFSLGKASPLALATSSATTPPMTAAAAASGDAVARENDRVQSCDLCNLSEPGLLCGKTASAVPFQGYESLKLQYCTASGAVKRNLNDSRRDTHHRPAPGAPVLEPLPT